MFIKQSLALGLLQDDPNTNILGAYPLQIKRTVVSSVAQHLSESSNTIKITLNTAAHVNWTMECVGQGFTLSTEEDEAVIASCIEVYRRWLFDPSNTPNPILADTEQIFIQTMFKHFSLLFQTKANYSAREHADKHADLCISVISIIRAAGKDLKLNADTWDVLLRLLMGIVDQLYIEGTNEIYFNKLISTVLKVMFEFVLLSHNKEIWNSLQKLEEKWVNTNNPIGTLSFVMHWNAVTTGLTNRVVSILYGGQSGTNNVVIKLLGDDPSQLNIQNDFTCYSWMRCLCLLGNPLSINSSKNFSEALRGLRNVTRSLISAPTPPNGNTILHLIGAWLFESIKLNRSGFEEGTSIAVEILCEIFFKLNSRTQFDGVYLASFYSCLANVLLMEGRVVVSCLAYTSEFFCYELPGCNVLLPFFIHAISNVFKKKSDQLMTSSGITPDSLREACIKTMSNILCFSNHFGTIKLGLHLPREFQVQDGSSLLPQITNYSALKPHIAYLILKGLQSESNNYNLKQLLSFLVVYDVEEIEYSNNDSVNQCLEVIFSKALSGSWTNDVILVAFKCIRNLASSTDPRKKTQAQTVFAGFSKFLRHIDNSSKNLEDMSALFTSSFRALSAWTSHHQFLENSPESVRSLFDACGINMDGERRRLMGEAREARDMLVFNSVNRVTKRGLSSHMTEQDIMGDIVAKSGGKIEDMTEYVRHYNTHNMIITTIDNPYSDRGPSCTFILRHKAGKFVWTSWPATTSFSNHGQSSYRVEEVNMIETPYQPTVRALDEDLFREFLEFLSRKSSVDGVVDMSGRQMTAEEDHLKQIKYRLNTGITMSPPTNSPEEIYSGESKNVTSRAFFNDVGMINVQSQPIMTQLSANVKKFTEELAVLDDLKERYTIQIGVVYVAKNQSNETEILSNRGGHHDYQKFLSNLGWGVDLEKHSGFSGNLDRSPKFSHGKIVPYYSDNSFEVIFQAPTLSPAETHHSLSEDIMNQVTIVWLESSTKEWNILHETVFKHNNHIVLIHPMQNGLFKVKSYTTKDLPASVNVVLRLQTLSKFVRMTAMDFFAQLPDRNSKPYASRSALIHDIGKKYGKNDALETSFISGFQSTKQSLRTLPGTLGITLPSTIVTSRPSSAPVSAPTTPPASDLLKRVSVHGGSPSIGGFVAASPLGGSGTLRETRNMNKSPSGKRFSLAEPRMNLNK